EAIPEHRRFCAACGEPVGRSSSDGPAQAEGTCRCGRRFSFLPSLRPGDVVKDQYEVIGYLGHGGMGWVYLAVDRLVNDKLVVLKGVIDEDSEEAARAATEELRFLSEVEHPNIVRVLNFAEHRGSGYIVMEYVDGFPLDVLRSKVRDNDDEWTVRVLAYGVALLGALAYLHARDLVFCDLKPGNVMSTGTGESVKLIDLGAVQLVHGGGVTFGTPGFEAPEVPQHGPSPASDLFSLSCTLRSALPSRETRSDPSGPTSDVPGESLQLWIAHGCEPAPERRFESAEAMAIQLLGVLQQLLTASGRPCHRGPSSLFSGDRCEHAEVADWTELPDPRPAESDDPALGDQFQLVEVLGTAGRWADSATVLERVHQDNPTDWRVPWSRALALLGQNEPEAAQPGFDEVRRRLPGELAPVLALAVAAERGRHFSRALALYDLVSACDPSFVSASLGAGRCAAALSDVDRAVASYDRVPTSSRLHLVAQTRLMAVLLDRARRRRSLEALAEVTARIDGLNVSAPDRAELVLRSLSTGLDLLTVQPTVPGDPGQTLHGWPATPSGVRRGLESAYRTLARLSPDREHRVAMVDLANSVRPRTWT
ncbi:MAG TPA: tetratricopeptide repeat protein, partial [Actinomycetes bacterium]|nr:tetratricopeptide repeat protein [Actinomycetes bacterium]